MRMKFTLVTEAGQNDQFADLNLKSLCGFVVWNKPDADENLGVIEGSTMTIKKFAFALIIQRKSGRPD